jgi:hypothetical protein
LPASKRYFRRNGAGMSGGIGAAAMHIFGENAPLKHEAFDLLPAVKICTTVQLENSGIPFGVP